MNLDLLVLVVACYLLAVGLMAEIRTADWLRHHQCPLCDGDGYLAEMEDA